MVLHWRRVLGEETDPARRRKMRTHLWINTVGAATTAIALVVIILAKFSQGAWITVMVVPAVILLLKAIRNYYAELEDRVRDPTPLNLGGLSPPIVLVAIEGWNQLADRAISLALTLSPHVIGVHLAQLAGPDEDYNRTLREGWERNVAAPARAAGFAAPDLVILQAQYRAIHEPVLKLARELGLKFPDRSVAVLIPELVKQRWYQPLLHTHRARRLRRQLLKHGGARLTIINVPWHLQETRLPQVAPEAA
jgi:hypothetical protein